MLEGAHTEVRVQAIAPADFPKAFEAFKRLPSGQLNNVEFTYELDLFIEIAAADIGLPAIHDTIKDARPIAAEGQAVVFEGIANAEPIAAGIFSIPPFGEPGFRRRCDTILRDSCNRPKGAGSHQSSDSDDDDRRCVHVRSRTNMLHRINLIA